MNQLKKGRVALDHVVQKDLREQGRFIRQQEEQQRSSLSHAFLQGVSAGYEQAGKIIEKWAHGKVWENQDETCSACGSEASL